MCRLRLEARWEDDGTVEGEVSQDLFWIDTLDDDPPSDKKHPVSAADRGLIQLYYTPASRDAGAQVRATTGALAARLLLERAWRQQALARARKFSAADTPLGLRRTASSIASSYLWYLVRQSGFSCA